MLLKIKVIPNAPKDEIVGSIGEELKIKLNAPAREGKANQALIQFLADKYKVKKSAVQIKSGLNPP